MRLVSQRLVAKKPDLASIATRGVGGGELDGGTQGGGPEVWRHCLAGIFFC